VLWSLPRRWRIVVISANFLVAETNILLVTSLGNMMDISKPSLHSGVSIFGTKCCQR
jgi:hypothetical protein